MANKLEKHKDQIINIELKSGTTPVLHYTDATLSIDSSIGCYVVEAIVQLPVSEEENAEKKYFHLVERLPFDSVLRIYTLNESR